MTETVPLHTIHPDPANLRRRDRRALDAIKASLARFGQVTPIVADARGIIRKGNGTWEAARELGWVEIEVIRTGLAGPEAVAYSIADNRTSDLSSFIEDDLAATLRALQSEDFPIESTGFTDAEVDELLERLGSEAVGDEGTGDGTGDGPDGSDDPDPGPPPDDSRPGGVPDAIWPTDNDRDIPALDPRMQADAVDVPVTAWGAVRRTAAMRGTWHFYTSDYRFSALWTRPDAVLATGCVAAVEPNYTTLAHSPLPFVLWSVYRKRWMARYWQSKDVRVFVDLDVHPRFREINLLGVPKAWRAFASRPHRDSGVGGLAADFAAAAGHVGTEALLKLVVGGGRAVQAWCGANDAVWVPEASQAKRTADTDGQQAG